MQVSTILTILSLWR